MLQCNKFHGRRRRFVLDWLNKKRNGDDDHAGNQRWARRHSVTLPPGFQPRSRSMEHALARKRHHGWIEQGQ
jgi:hypothetical protein